jgi:myo-inositol 2-dehydrogenase/D-chiro-inositol 1-dehydrogenase
MLSPRLSSAQIDSGHRHLYPYQRGPGRVAAYRGETPLFQMNDGATSVATPVEQMVIGQKSIGIAVLGAGRIGALHAANVARGVPGAHLAGVADVDPAAAERAVQSAGSGRAVTDYRELLADPTVAAVVIATPTDTHAQLMREAAAAGKQIFCEKPIALTLEATRAAIDAVAATGVSLQIGFNRRFDAPYAQARAAIARGDIGEPWIVKLVGRDPRIAPLSYLRVSGGQFKDQAIHEYDAARWLIGREVEEVFATGSVLVDPAVGEIGDVDTSLTTLRFEGGALGLVDSCRQAVYGFDVRAEVHGSDGKLLIGYEGRTAVTLLEPNRASHDHIDWFLDRFAEAYRAELEQFVVSLREGTPPSPTAEDGYRALQIAVAAGRSLRERRMVRLGEVTSG